MQIYPIKLPVFALLVAIGCGGTPPVRQAANAAVDRAPRAPLSADEHDRVAEYHVGKAKDARAAAEKAKQDEDAMGPAQCFDDPVTEQGSSGGEGYQPPRKCWAPYDRPSAKLGREAKWHEEEAASHKRIARQLRDDERDACKTLSADDPNPFSRPEAITSVEPHRESGELRGVRVVFRADDGRTGRLLESRLQCHLARLAAQGFPDDHRDPVAVLDAETLVSGDESDIVVVIRVPAALGQEVLNRAKALAPGP